jgi:hypothetical protein
MHFRTQIINNIQWFLEYLQETNNCNSSSKRSQLRQKLVLHESGLSLDQICFIFISYTLSHLQTCAKILNFKFCKV